MKFVNVDTLRSFGRLALYRGYTIEGAYTFASASVGRTLDEGELGEVADAWNAERAISATNTKAAS